LFQHLQHAHPAKELNMKAKIPDGTRASNTPQFKQASRASEWFVPAGLLLLSFIPIAGGAFRLTQLAGGAQITPANARFFASPLPVVLHVFSVTIFSLLGAFQFAPGFRRRHLAWHRAAGRILIPSGLMVALCGLWMTLFYPWPKGDGELLYGFRLLFGSLMLVSILLGVAAIQRRNFVQHGHWMMRGYALGLGAGTQALTLMAWEVFLGKPEEFPRALLMGASWVINLIVAEWIIRKPSTPRARTASAVVSHL
jgi:uncharacterized membrane protein